MAKRIEELECINSYAALGPGFYAPAEPRPFDRPRLAAFNPDAARLIDLDSSESARSEFLEYFGGKRLIKGSQPVAMRYTGHQFGVYNPDIGDGRAILLGEICGSEGKHWDLHLKGAGRTAYARVFDGRAVLRSTIREYLCGEAMHGLGIPTTRSLCIIGSDEPVERERVETGAMLIRMAETHIRFGSFEAFYYAGETENLRTLADYVVKKFYGDLMEDDNPYLSFLREVIRRTARLIAQWQTGGFTHGVMNTDNMSIVGLTLDYGPFGFMEDYDPGYIPNHSDEAGRYAYDRQPPVALWNLVCLAQCLAPLAGKENAARSLEAFVAEFETRFLDGMRHKLGLFRPQEDDGRLVGELLGLLKILKLDYTIFFRSLSQFNGDENTLCPAHPLRKHPEIRGWLNQYRGRLARETAPAGERKLRMDRSNPKFILRNYLAKRAIDKAERGDYSEIERLRRLLSAPFDEHPDMENYAELSPDWAKNLVVSCSS